MLGDGWFPTYMPLGRYKKELKVVKDAVKRAGRDPESVTPAMWCYVVIDEDPEECRSSCLPDDQGFHADYAILRV